MRRPTAAPGRRPAAWLALLEQKLQSEPSTAAEVAPSAAVAAVLRPRGDDVEVLFIRRAVVEGDPWSGHMAFPGGRRDPEDRSLLATARRETLEEVGLDLASLGRPLGRLDDVPTHRRGMVVSPFVFAIEGNPRLTPNREVDATLWTRIGPLLRGERDTSYAFPYAGQVHRMPGYDVDGNVVWGLTYRMLQLLFDEVR